MEKMAGQWPSLAPTNSILQHRALSRIQAHTQKNDNTKPLWASDYLGAPKKPPLSAPRQDMATRTGITGANP